jgi:alanine dehydrogenase
MVVGVPKEIKTDERRVALVPAGVAAFVSHGHTVFVEKGAGLGSGISDAEYRAAGARIVQKAGRIWTDAELVIKVKEPLGRELRLMREEQIVFTYLHLASNEKLTKTLMRRGVTAIGYETIQLDDRSLPLLMPMSEVAGRLSIQKGAACLEAMNGGRGILLGGVSGVKPANVLVLGAGVAGFNACYIAVGMGARVTIMDVVPSKLRYVHDVMGGHVTTLMSNRANIAEEVADADLVIGSVLVPGARTDVLVTRAMLKNMRPGSVIVDLAVDQGGCCATTQPTTHSDPTYIVDGVVHYCVANMPGAVPRTSTYGLTNVTAGYALALADKGFEQAIADDPALRKGVNTYDGGLTHPAVAEAFGLECSELAA